MLLVQQILAYTVVSLNIGITIWATVSHKPIDGIGTFMTGNCSTISQLNTGFHLLLNVISTLFLGAGNYCMQILVAPSREEIEDAHEKRESLDIGIPSFRNLHRIARARRLLWLAIGTVATVLHLLSVIIRFLTLTRLTFFGIVGTLPSSHPFLLQCSLPLLCRATLSPPQMTGVSATI